MFFRKIALALTTMAAFAGIARGDTRTLTHEAVINAPVSAVWRAFTDEKEVMTWMTPLADIDLRVGGLMRTNYNPNGEIGDATTIANQILSFEPERMLSIKNVQAPEGFPWKENFQGTWSVMYFTPSAQIARNCASSAWVTAMGRSGSSCTDSSRLAIRW